MLFLLLLLLPSQLGLHFWPSWSFVSGLPVDYLSPTLYFTDLLIILLLTFWVFRSIRLIKSIKINWFFVAVVAFAVANIIFSYSPPLAFYKWLRLTEYFFLGLYVHRNSSSLFTIYYSLPLAIIWASGLAWWQFLRQSSVGGLWYWLGERSLTITAPGIAKISLGDLGLRLRPYSVFPHPNALAGFLLVSGLIVYYFYSQKKFKLGVWSLVIAAATLPMTFSRTAIFLELLLITLWIFSKFRLKFVFKILSVFLLLTIYYLLFTKIGNPSSLPERLTQYSLAYNVVQKHPLFGIGLSNFIPYISANYQLTTNNYNLSLQPVHNIYLLLASELGLPVLFTIFYLFFNVVKKLLVGKQLILTTALVTVLVSGLSDHYWLTLHQNSLLLTILISLIYSNLTLNYERRTNN
ncbi:hypothetical protein A3H89_03885 [Candidatus Amesbacteria bacterium RIFCSPLOWO2_02_FULL_48_11]|uniref:O-antigen ligase-related domain-containing protein n=2 Tax=Candidatus Amesiibacteriota TaxID=1752730 RepID=A0A1F4Z4J5_9BACT|nr:MAG: hypothetical protein UY22_C0010G0013 [Candidatus Amesbacteria bacterium GW2011_GWC1_48_10]OGC91419.1 MAG: hypothetical protein A2V48_03905 [Candidatus Amesbacteria bacterium RBG_19FT_COMBO_48_16]OGC95229.1 MAG: hypothetical protein A3C34_04620 [Candidatus Amesbacteria bacterium RIFCSPHIGHO2_02_FULL_48_21]OGC98898.1 MAG: hypothetical protein A2W16_00440 [Candidatus Amesbacteria bacterium RBG_16_48_31]OGD00519.1 MAG: hypothetical protein A2702_02215 [Candidatus Amesbacteria bacterium RIFC